MWREFKQTMARLLLWSADSSSQGDCLSKCAPAQWKRSTRSYRLQITRQPVSRFALSLLAWTVGLVQSGPLPTSLRAPAVQAILEDDSLRIVGHQEVWRIQYAQVSGSAEPWVILTDPFGGRTRTPALYFLSISNDLEAFIEGAGYVSVVYLRRSLYIPVALIFLIGVLTIVTFPFLRYRKRIREERALRTHLEEGRETERLRLAQDLHDGPVQDLNAIRLRLSMLARETAHASEDTLEETIDEVQRVILVLREISELLRPPSLGPFGLATALRAYADRFQSKFPGVDVDLDLQDDHRTLPDPVRLALFRIAQEAMTNAARHGNPGLLQVALRLNDGEVELTVTDDGEGFDVPDDFHALGRDRHYGLLGMSERTGSIGASIKVESFPGTVRPTRVSVVVPKPDEFSAS